MSIKLIATDLDGTLMAPDHMTVTQRTKDALMKAKEKGVKIVIATGRALNATDSVVSQIPFVDYILYCNGAAVYDRENNKEIYENPICEADAIRITDFLIANPIHFHIYKDGKIFAPKNVLNFTADTQLPEEFLKEFMKQVILVDSAYDAVNGGGVQVMDTFNVPENLKNELFALVDELGLITTSAVKSEIAITAKGADKGSAIKGLCDALGITADEVMTFGDAPNDCPMLEFAKYSFAMGNGAEICKQTANFTAPSNAEDGVAAMVEKYVLKGE